MATKSQLKEFDKKRYDGVDTSKLEARIAAKLQTLKKAGKGKAQWERSFNTLKDSTLTKKKQMLGNLLDKVDRFTNRLPKATNEKSPKVEIKPNKKTTPEVKKEKGPSFKEAFAAARKKFIAGGGKASDYTFSWGGKKFHILRGDDKGGSLAEKKKNLLEAIKAGKKVRGS